MKLKNRKIIGLISESKTQFSGEIHLFLYWNYLLKGENLFFPSIDTINCKNLNVNVGMHQVHKT